MSAVFMGVKHLKLGERLLAIAAFVPVGARMADIGTDHAYLPIYLLQKKHIISAVAGEVNKGPFSSAQEAIKSVGLQDEISLRLGNGLDVLSPGEVDVAVIAGMGGATIIDILHGRPQVTRSLGQLILQPMIAASLVRRWLFENNWCISDEALVKEEGRLYEIIVAKPGSSDELEPILYEIGPVLWRNRPVLLKEHVENLIVQAKRILTEMSISDRAQALPKFREYAKKIEQLEAKLACL